MINRKPTGQFTLEYRVEFHAAHHLPNYDGLCANVHGHNWIAEFTVRSSELDEQGMVVDFGTLKKLCPDHADLNKWMDGPPTTENVARELFERLEKQLVDRPVTVVSVKLWENQRACVTFQRQS